MWQKNFYNLFNANEEETGCRLLWVLKKWYKKNVCQIPNANANCGEWFLMVNIVLNWYKVVSSQSQLVSIDSNFNFIEIENCGYMFMVLIFDIRTLGAFYYTKLNCMSLK